VTGRTKFRSHEEYIAAAAAEARPRLHRIQSIVEASVPGAVRRIGYNIPAYALGRTFFYFAAFKRHIGIYPPLADDAKLVVELAPFRNEKGNLAFPLNAPLPEALVGRVAVALAKQYAGKPPTAAVKR
jgi:uncharacterized protein YdhG (YjbR/CyaY superfamily)